MENVWLGLTVLTVVFLASIYLISKGIETVVRGIKSSNPNRNLDLLVGFLMLIPGILAGGFG
ncbi:MAG: hypothetical protein PSX80_16290 [bacterium]|nr:hypothetical protein [bacterium]